MYDDDDIDDNARKRPHVTVVKHRSAVWSRLVPVALWPHADMVICCRYLQVPLCEFPVQFLRSSDNLEAANYAAADNAAARRCNIVKN